MERQSRQVRRNTGHGKDTKTLEDRYCRKRNKALLLNDKLRRNFELLIAKEAKTKPKAFWKYVKSQTSSRAGLSPLETQNGCLTKDDTEKAEVLNTFFWLLTYFQKAFGLVFASFAISSSKFRQENLETMPTLPDRVFKHPISDPKITYQEVEKAITKLKPDKSPGPDKIHSRILRECSQSMKTPLTVIFQKSLREGKVPNQWKEAHVTPIYKKGRKKQPSNYRPVSLTSIVCKLMERLIRNQIMEHMDKNKLFTDLQYGFRNKRSTVLQLLKVLDQWTEMLDEGNCLDVLYLALVRPSTLYHIVV